MKSILQFFTPLRFKHQSVSAMIRLKSGRPLIRILVILIRAFGSSVRSPSMVRVVCSIIFRLSKVYKHQGLRGLVIYCKVNYVLTQQAISGYSLEDLTPLGCRVSRTGTGLPTIIPAHFRDRLMRGETAPIRVVLTIFSIYRVIEIPGKVKIQSITAPYSGNLDLEDIYSFIPRFISLFVPYKFSYDPIAELRKCGKTQASWSPLDRENYPLSKSSPMSSVVSRNLGLDYQVSSWHPFSAILSAIAIVQDKRLFDSLIYICDQTCGIMSHSSYFLFKTLSYLTDKNICNTSLPLGKLGLKLEAAGKMRVFAMVDPWTNWILYPLHKFLFKILEYNNDVDGTFNQLSPLYKCMGAPYLASLDLSSATDRLPILLQIRLLNGLFPLTPNFGEHWANSLVGRDYELYDRKSRKTEKIRYSVGQPMGALSSWAMLAFTHHFIVQVAAWQAGFSRAHLFKGYAILGDDIVISDKRVANAYLLLIKKIGVECGLAKSILSSKGIGLEFAKRTFVGHTDVSPISLLEFSSALQSISAAVSFGMKYQLSPAAWLSCLGYGYKVTGGANKPFRKLKGTVCSLLVAYSYPFVANKDVFNFLHLKSIQDKAKDIIPAYLVNTFILTQTAAYSKRVDKLIQQLLMRFKASSWSGQKWPNPLFWTLPMSTIRTFLGSDSTLVSVFKDRFPKITFPLSSEIPQYIWIELLESYMTDIVKVVHFDKFLSGFESSIKELILQINSQRSMTSLIPLYDELMTHLLTFRIDNPLSFKAHDIATVKHGVSPSSVIMYRDWATQIRKGLRSQLQYKANGIPLFYLYNIIKSVIPAFLSFARKRPVVTLLGFAVPAQYRVMLRVTDYILSVMIVLFLGLVMFGIEEGFSYLFSLGILQVFLKPLLLTTKWFLGLGHIILAMKVALVSFLSQLMFEIWCRLELIRWSIFFFMEHLRDLDIPLLSAQGLAEAWSWSSGLIIDLLTITRFDIEDQLINPIMEHVPLVESGHYNIPLVVVGVTSVLWLMFIGIEIPGQAILA